MGDRVNAGRRAAIYPVAAFWLVGASGVLGAVPSSVRGQSARRLDLVVVTLDPSVYGGFRRAVVPMLERRPVAARVSRGAELDRREVLRALDGVDDGVVKVWVDARPGQVGVRVLLVHGRDGRVLVRTVSGGDGDADLVLAREQVAQILVAALDSLRAGEGVGVSRDRAQADLAAMGVDRDADDPGSSEADTPDPTAESDDDRDGDGSNPRDPDVGPPRHALGVSMAGRWVNADPFLAQAEATLRYTGRWLVGELGDAGPGFALAGELALGWGLPVTQDDDPLGVRLHGPTVRGMLVGELALGDGRLADDPVLRVRAGIGADVVRVTPVTGSVDGGAGTAVEQENARWESQAIFPLDVGVAWPLGGAATRLRIELGVDVGARRVRYVVVDDGRRDVVLSPMRARPRLGLGVDGTW